MTSAPRAGRAGRVALALLATIAAAASGIPTTAVAAPAAPAAPAAAAGTTAVAQDDEPQLVLVRQTPWVEPDGSFVLQVEATGTVPAGATVEATMFEATASRSDFTAQLAGEDLGDTLGDSGGLALTGTATRTAEARFATDGSPAGGEADTPLTSAGVHPVEARLLGPDGAVLDRLVTHLVRVPDTDSEAPPLNVAVVVPVDGGAGVSPDGSRRTGPGTGSRVNTLLNGLNRHPDVPLTVVPVPETVVSMSGTPRIGRLRRAVEDRQVLASQYVPVDEAAWVASGLGDDLIRQTTAGEQALVDRLVGRPDRRTVVADDTLTADALNQLRDLGADQLIIPEAALAPVDETSFPTTLTQTFQVQDSSGRNARSVVADPALQAHIEATDDPVLNASNLLADLAVLYLDRPVEDRGVAVTLPRLWAPSADFLDTFVGALEDSRVVVPVTIDQLFARVPDATTGGPDDPDGEPLVRTLEPEPSPSLGGYPQALPLTRLTTQGFSSFADGDNPLVASMQRRLLVSGSADFDRAQRRAYLEAISGQVQRSAAAVKPPERGNITLTSRDGSVPLNISNENLFDVTVLVEFDSDDLSFPDGDRLIVHLPRSEVTTREIAVRARSSGTFPLRMTITSPDEVVLVSRSRFTVRSTAVSGVGLFLSIGAGLFLALWWASHFRKVRRARKLVDADEAAAAVAAADAAD